MAERGAEQGTWSGAGAIRLVVGLVQAIAIYSLIRTDEAKVWPASEPLLFTPLVLISLYVPLIVLAGVSGLKRATLVVWTLVAILFLAGLAIHDVVRESSIDQHLPSFPVFAFTAAALFVGHHLIAAADAERKFIASYPAYFDAAWKNGVQLALSLAFVSVFWMVLGLGAALFNVIGIDFLQVLIGKPEFAIPATTLSFAAAVHITDVRVDLIRGIRTVGLTLLSWLLPVMGIIAVGFVASLPFTGLQPLWDTGSATPLLLSSAAVLILLTNATYQDGGAAVAPSLRWACRGAAILLPIFVGIASYAVWLRIDQHGLTPDRIIAAALILVAVIYAIGYFVAAVWPGRWLRPLEKTNVAAAVFILAVIVALFTPIADPARIAVADQVRRLEQGLVSVDEFDFEFLRFDGARYGRDALQRLTRDASGPDAARIAEKARAALELENPWERKTVTQFSQVDLSVFPVDATLPQSFLDQDWGEEGFVPCLSTSEACDAFVVELNGDGEAEILVGSAGNYSVFDRSADGRWRLAGSLEPAWCDGIGEALREGRWAAAPPVWNDLVVGDQRLRLSLRTGCAEGVDAAPETEDAPTSDALPE